jgi:hypothetical protein
MNLEILTDKELINWVVNHDRDPIRLRLANFIFENTEDIITDLEYAGMDRDSLLFENKFNPGDYIRHLRSEIEYILDELRDTTDELDEVRDELKGLKTMTVVNLISELKDKISDMDLKVRYAEFEREKAYKEVEETRAKMKVWRAISTEL